MWGAPGTAALRRPGSGRGGCSIVFQSTWHRSRWCERRRRRALRAVGLSGRSGEICRGSRNPSASHGTHRCAPCRPTRTSRHRLPAASGRRGGDCQPSYLRHVSAPVRGERTTTCVHVGVADASSGVAISQCEEHCGSSLPERRQAPRSGLANLLARASHTRMEMIKPQVKAIFRPSLQVMNVPRVIHNRVWTVVWNSEAGLWKA